MSVLLGVVGVAVVLVGQSAAQTQVPEILNQKLPQRFTALLTDFNPERPASMPVEIDIRRWSTDAEADTLIGTLREKGNDGLLDVLSKQPRVGTIRPLGSLGWDLRYARQQAGEDGGRSLFIVTDRWISFLEYANLAPSLRYPFTVIQLQLNGKGEGQGTMALATRLQIIRNLMVIDSYEFQDIQLRGVKQQK